MAQIDISSKIGNEKPTIKVAEGKVYEVDNSADKYLVVQEKIKNQDFSISVMYEMIEMLMGKDALKEIKGMKLSATIDEVSYEEMEKRFQQ